MFTDKHVDTVAQRLCLGQQTTEEVRTYLLDNGLTDYQAFLCWHAAKLLLRVGYYTKGESIEV